MIEKIKKKVPVKLKGDERNIFLFREEGEKLIIQGTHIIYILENTAKDIYNTIDDKKTVEEIIKKLSFQYNSPQNKIEKDVIEFIKYLVDKEIVKLKSF